MTEFVPEQGLEAYAGAERAAENPQVGPSVTSVVHVGPLSHVGAVLCGGVDHLDGRGFAAGHLGPEVPSLGPPPLDGGDKPPPQNGGTAVGPPLPGGEGREDLAGIRRYFRRWLESPHPGRYAILGDLGAPHEHHQQGESLHAHHGATDVAVPILDGGSVE